MIETTRVRFAPSPTGYLHIGSARAALFNFLFARHTNGVFILRIEDTDVQRSTEESYRSILDGLQWLGILWDEGPDVGGPKGPYIQSQRRDIYESYLQKLWDKGLIYECYCTPEELETRRQEAIKNGGSIKYDGRCSNLTQNDREKFKNEGRKSSIRFKVPEGKYIVNDIVRGDVEFDSEQIGDFIIRRSDGGFPYNFANVIDDALMEITHIIRGEDLLPSTPRHIMLYNAFEFPVPKFAHLPMILGPDRSKLSKRHGATSVMEYKSEGFLSDAIVNFLALLGWMPAESPEKDDENESKMTEIMSRNEIIAKFSLERISKSGAIFDIGKLKWMNGVYIRKLDDKQLLQETQPFIKEEFKQRGKDLLKAVQLVKNNLSTLNEVNDYIKVFFEMPIYTSGAIEEQINKNVFLKVIRVLIEVLNQTEIEIDDINIKDIVKKVTSESGVKGKDLYMSIRLGVTAQVHGPDLVGTLVVLGKEEILKRLKLVLSNFKE